MTNPPNADQVVQEIEELREKVAMMQRSIAAGGKLTPEGQIEFVEDLKEVYAALSLIPRWVPVSEFTEKHADDDGLYAFVCNNLLDIHCAAVWLGDNNWQCLEGGELLEWIPTHAMLLIPTPPEAGDE